MSVKSCEFVGVLALKDNYLSVYFHNGEMTILSDYLETDRKVIECAARAFAEQHFFRYEETTLTPNLPMATVLNYQQEWFPAILGKDGFSIVKNRGLEIGKKNLQTAIDLAKKMALEKRMACIPAIGIILHTRKGLKLQGIGITDSSLGKRVRRIPNMYSLTVSDCSITNLGLKNLQQLTALKRLILQNCPRITDTGLRDLVLPSMKYLEVQNCPLVTESGLDRLMNDNHNLQEVVSYI